MISLDMPLDMVKASFFGTRRAPHLAKGPCEGYCNYGCNYKKTALRRFYNAGQCGVYCGCAAKPNPAGCGYLLNKPLGLKNNKEMVLYEKEFWFADVFAARCVGGL